MKRATPDNKILPGKPSRTKKEKTTKEADLTIQDILGKPGLVRQVVVDHLHWKDAISLGSTHQECRAFYLAQRETILGPLLDLLEKLCGSHVHAYCGKTYAPISERVCTCDNNDALEEYFMPGNQELAALDPRYDDDYESLSISDKCATMIDFLSTLVSNMRPHLNLAMGTMANPNHMPESIGTIQGNWSLGVGHSGNAVLSMYPGRAAFAFNLALTCFAQSAMNSGDDSYFNQAFLGESGIDPGGSGFGQAMCSYVESMLPLRNKDFVKFLRESVLPSSKEMAILGPTLTSRVLLTAPLLEWIIHDSNEIVLPAGLEEFDHVAVQRAVDEWDPLDDGRGEDW